MSQPDFDEYIQSICKGIKSRPMREEVMEELSGHLEDNYERNLAVGMSEDEARQNAIDKMGDREALAYRLSAVHSYSPLKEMNSSFVQVIIGFICMNFVFSGTVKEILVISGSILMFSSLLRMRKMNGKTEKAFHFFNFFALTQLFYYCVSVGNILPVQAENIYFAVNSLFKGLFWLFLFRGFNETIENHIDEEQKKPKLVLCGIFYMVLSFVTGGVLILSEGETVTVNDFVIPIVLIFMFGYTVVQLVRTKNILWDADGEYGILPADKKHITVCGCVISVCIATVLAFNYASATRSPVKTELVIHDASAEEQAEADKIRQKMLDWDVKEQIVEDLPDSEILKYKDAEFVTWGADGGSLGGATSVFGADSIVWYYWFFIPDKEYEGSYDVRLLCYVESNYADSIKSFYRKGFYYMPWGKGVFPLNLEDELNGSFISIVTEENGKKYNAEPFFTHNMTDEDITVYPKGFEYREEKGQRVYYATQIGVANPEENSFSIYGATVRKRWFFSFNCKTSADFTETILKGETLHIPQDAYLPYYYRLHNINTESLFMTQ